MYMLGESQLVYHNYYIRIKHVYNIVAGGTLMISPLFGQQLTNEMQLHFKNIICQIVVVLVRVNQYRNFYI